MKSYYACVSTPATSNGGLATLEFGPDRGRIESFYAGNHTPGYLDELFHVMLHDNEDAEESLTGMLHGDGFNTAENTEIIMRWLHQGDADKNSDASAILPYITGGAVSPELAGRISVPDANGFVHAVRNLPDRNRLTHRHISSLDHLVTAGTAGVHATLIGDGTPGPESKLTFVDADRKRAINGDGPMTGKIVYSYRTHMSTVWREWPAGWTRQSMLKF